MDILRPYQNRDYTNILNQFKEHNSVLYQCPTGGGKSVIIERFVLDHKTEKILILAHKRELVFQIKNRLEASGLRVGVIIGNIEENLDSNIIIASVRTVTLEKRIETILKKKFNKVITDEAHHIRTNSYENVLDKTKEQNPDFKLLGVTATPWRKDRKALNKYFDVLICSNDIKTLQADGFLAKYKVFYTPTLNIEEEVDTAGGDYQIQSLSDFMRKPEMLQFAVDSYKQKGENKQMIVFCVDKKHAKEVKLKYEENGFKNIAHIDSDTKLNERAEILSKFAKNKLQIITCIETLTEGVDLPETNVIQLLRPTQSLILYLQMVGRGLRPKKDGSECIILDCAGCTLEHKAPDSPREWSLNPDINPSNPGKKNRVVGKREDGTFTEDETEMSFLELVEMTPEEYAVNISGGIEKSEQMNKDADNKCVELLRELGKFIHEKIKAEGYIFNPEDISGDYFSKTRININNKKAGYGIRIEYQSQIKCFDIALDSYSYSIKDINSAKNKLLNNVTIGELSKELLKDKNLNHIVDTFIKVEEIQKDKINIQELKAKAKEFHREQVKIKAQHYLIKNNTITLPKEINLCSYFPRENYHYFKEMKFSRNKLMAVNKVTIRQSVKDIKLETIVEMLEDAGWEGK